MRTINIISWLIWFFSLGFLLVTVLLNRVFSPVIFFFMFVLIGLNMYIQGLERVRIKRFMSGIGDIDLSPLMDGLKAIKQQRAEYQLKLLDLEFKIKELEEEREQKYRDVVRKVLEMDNKLNEKFKLLGESILQISRKGK